MPVQHPRRQVVVTVCKDSRAHRDLIVHNPTSRIPPAIDLRFDFLNDYPAATFGRLHAIQLSTDIYLGDELIHKTTPEAAPRCIQRENCL